MTQRIEAIQPADWTKPRGYSNGMAASGRVVYVAGQIAFNAEQEIVSDDFVSQFKQALSNVRAVVEAAGGRREDLVRLTIYVVDLDAYRNATKEVGAAYREVLGKHFPAMALVGVAGLVAHRAQVEIEGTAVLEDAR